MAQFFKAKPTKTKKHIKAIVNATTLDHQGQGIAQHQGKVMFVPGLLPNEQAEVLITEQKKNYAKSNLIAILQQSDARVTPDCPYYADCGGCDLQHLAVSEQHIHKKQVISDLFHKFTSISSLPPIELISDQNWHYRRKARLATWYDRQKRTFTLGFRAKASKNVIAIGECKVLSTPLSDLIKPLAVKLAHLQLVSSLGHVELIDVENGVFVVLRVTKTVSDKDKKQLQEFAQVHQVEVVLQGNDNIQYLTTETKPFYQLNGLSSQPLKLEFNPSNFIQVNNNVNQLMISTAMNWLAPRQGEHVLDLFCGVGNFSLPLAAMGAKVTGVEGVNAMVEQAKQNAKTGNFKDADFHMADLSADLSAEPWLKPVDKLLLDPARAGAYDALIYLNKIAPKMVLYVSCDPISLARDAKVLLEQGYELTKLTLFDMFPQTHHIETMALFIKSK